MRDAPPQVSEGSLLDAVEEGPLDARYWRSFAVLAMIFAVDYFDIFIIGFLVSDFAPAWQLTYAQTALILLGAGVGSIIGALAGGILSDRFGRLPLLIVGNIICGIASGGVALVPDGQWGVVALLRVFTGLAIGIIATATIAMIVERTPRRYRTLISGLNLIAPSAGVLLASLCAGWLLDHLGWRGVAALGAIPLLLVPLTIAFVSESVHWQVATGRLDEARRNASRLVGYAVDHLPMPNRPKVPTPKGLAVLYRDPRRFWLVLLIALGAHAGIYGTYLWAPSILAAVANISPAEAASMFALSSMLGVGGKLLFSFVPAWIGRWPTGVLCLGMGTLSLAGAAMAGDAYLGPLPLILFCFAGVSLFLDGGSANFHPYSAEVFPVALASRGVGLAQAGNGIAKILGPMSLALIAGSADVMKPKATADAVAPAFLFLAACAFVGLIAMLVVRIETRGRRLTLDADFCEPDQQPATAIRTELV